MQTQKIEHGKPTDPPLLNGWRALQEIAKRPETPIFHRGKWPWAQARQVTNRQAFELVAINRCDELYAFGQPDA